MTPADIEALARRLPSAHAVKAASALAKQLDALERQFGCKLTVVGSPLISAAHRAAFAGAAARFEARFWRIA